MTEYKSFVVEDGGAGAASARTTGVELPVETVRSDRDVWRFPVGSDESTLAATGALSRRGESSRRKVCYLAVAWWPHGR